MRTSPAELLAANGIALESTAPGRYYTMCPQCSHTRSEAHQKAKCLGVTIEGDSARWGCNHCGWTGPAGRGNPKPELPSHRYADGKLRKVCNPPGSKNRFRWEHWDGQRWQNGIGGVKTGDLLYRIDEARKAIEAGREVCCVEGEKDADSLWRLNIPATCNAHGASDVIKNPKAKPKWTTAHSAQLKDASIVVFNDNDAPGYAHADATCKLSLGVAKRVRRLDLKPHWPEIGKGQDVSDWLAVGGDHARERLLELIANAPDITGPEKPGPTPDDDAEIERLARLSALEYERGRKQAAEKLEIRATLLDKLIAAKRAELGLDENRGKQGHAIAFPEPDPWPEPIADAAGLFDEVAAAVRSHVVMLDPSKHATTMWIPHSHLIAESFISPRLAIRSPTKQCGKTTLLDVLAHLVAKPLRTDNCTPSTLFRIIEPHAPTLLVDEFDAFGRDNEELRGILNSGYRRGGHVLRNVGDDHEPRAFGTFAATVIAAIGTLPGTLIDRSIIIDLIRRKAAEGIIPFRLDRTEHLDELARKIARWCKDNAAAIAAIEPKMPESIINRAADNWRPLMAIAEVVGGEWPERIRKAIIASNPETIEEASQIELLLGDIRDIFVALKVERISSAHLIEGLCEIVPRPWAEYGKGGKPITQNKMARLLKPLGIAPQQVRVSETDDEGKAQEIQVRGYERSQFDEGFERYLAPLDPEKGSSNRHTVTNTDHTGTSDVSQTVTAKADVTDRKSQKPNNDGFCDGVTVRKGETATMRERASPFARSIPSRLGTKTPITPAATSRESRLGSTLNSAGSCVRNSGCSPSSSRLKPNA